MRPSAFARESHPWSSWPQVLVLGVPRDYYHLESWMQNSSFEAVIAHPIINSLNNSYKGRHLKNPIGLLRLPIVAGLEDLEIDTERPETIARLLSKCNDSIAIRTFLKIPPGEMLGRAAKKRERPDSRGIAEALVKFRSWVSRYAMEFCLYWKSKHPRKRQTKRGPRPPWMKKMDIWTVKYLTTKSVPIPKLQSP